MRDPACSAGGGLLELAVAEHLFTGVVLTAGSAPSLFDWHRSCGGGLSEEDEQPHVLHHDWAGAMAHIHK